MLEELDVPHAESVTRDPIEKRPYVERSLVAGAAQRAAPGWHWPVDAASSTRRSVSELCRLPHRCSSGCHRATYIANCQVGTTAGAAWRTPDVLRSLQRAARRAA